MHLRPQPLLKTDGADRARAAVKAAPGSGRARVHLASAVDDEAFKIAQLEAVVGA